MGQVGSFHQYLVGFVREIGLSGSLHTGQVLDVLVNEQFYLLGVGTEFLEQEPCNVLGLLQYTFQQMYRLDGLLAVQLCAVDCLLHGLLCFDGKLV